MLNLCVPIAVSVARPSENPLGQENHAKEDTAMEEIQGKVAVITGGASGIGRATGALLASRGMKVVLADVEQGALDDTVAQLRGRGLEVSGVRTDVSSFDSMSNLVDETRARHGKVHVAFLNAGVSGNAPGALWEHEINDWAWHIAVNLWGVINGVKALVPAMLEHGEPGQVVITSSSVGVVAPVPSAPEYSMTKAAIFSIAEMLYAQLRQRQAPITASVLVPPGTINTALFSAVRNRPAQFAPSAPRKEAAITYEELLRRMNAAGNPRRPVQPEEVAEYVLDGILEGRFWIVPDRRHADIARNFDEIIRARADAMLGRNDPLTYLQKAM
jgi:NAD(P)-dependent dehydrogenase (short-subunit alcohol dehydrogenase family)